MSDGIPTEDFYAMSLIWQMRLYDVMMLVARNADKTSADALLELHAKGQILGPPPLYMPNEE